MELLRNLCDIGYHLEVPPVPLKVTVISHNLQPLPLCCLSLSHSNSSHLIPHYCWIGHSWPQLSVTHKISDFWRITFYMIRQNATSIYYFYIQYCFTNSFFKLEVVFDSGSREIYDCRGTCREKSNKEFWGLITALIFS